MTTRPALPHHSRSRHHLIFAVSAVALVSAAVGGCANHAAARPSSLSGSTRTSSAADSGQTTGSGGTACTLVTAADVTTAMGEPMTQLGGTAADCIYAASADHSQQLMVHEFLDQTNMTNTIQQLESSSEHVDGLGDDAFWNGTIDTMLVRTGSRGFTITSTSLGAKTPTDPDAPKAALVDLATSALSHL